MRQHALIRIALGLVALTCAILLSLDMAGFAPALHDRESEARYRACEEIAYRAARAVSNRDYRSLRVVLSSSVRAHEDILSAGLREATGKLLAATPGHSDLWQPKQLGSSLTHIHVPVLADGRRWGTVEIRFADSVVSGLWNALWQRPMVRLMLAVGSIGFFVYLLYMRQTLRFLDPSAVIPRRVQAAFDVMAEGVLLLDRNDRVVLANATFADYVDMPTASLLGIRASELAWAVPKETRVPSELPWRRTLELGETVRGEPLSLRAAGDKVHTLMVSAAPVADGAGKPQGAIVTFDNVTELEQKSEELRNTMRMLERSRDEIRSQNQVLQRMADSDPLTGVANRRAFFQTLAETFARARESGKGLCCIMADIDDFKRINDLRGHLVGDAVITKIAGALRAQIGSLERVCRYGGEEFCCAIPEKSLAEATALAERCRQIIGSEGFAEIPISVSFGVSSIELGAPDAETLLDQADRALYHSKKAGRNCVSRYDALDGHDIAPD